jgi:hypothetical protein
VPYIDHEEIAMVEVPEKKSADIQVTTGLKDVFSADNLRSAASEGGAVLLMVVGFFGVIFSFPLNSPLVGAGAVVLLLSGMVVAGRNAGKDRW